MRKLRPGVVAKVCKLLSFGITWRASTITNACSIPETNLIGLRYGLGFGVFNMQTSLGTWRQAEPQYGSPLSFLACVCSCSLIRKPGLGEFYHPDFQS